MADLLPDRTSATVAEWLRQRPRVEVVARDRSTEHARAVAIGAPRAVQVADRWHLLANMRQALERWLHTVHARLRRLAPARAGASDVSAIPPRRDQGFRRTRPDRAARAERHGRWQARYEEVRRRHLAGEPLMAIARAMGLTRGTVRKFAHAESFPARLPHGPAPSILDPYLPHLERRLAEGCENGMVLRREPELLTLFVTIPLKPECVEEYLDLVNELNDAMRYEPTFVSTVPSRSADDPALITIHEVWIDREDFFAVQMKRGYRQRYEQRLPQLLRGEREMRIGHPVRGDYAFMSGIGTSLLKSGRAT